MDYLFMVDFLVKDAGKQRATTCKYYGVWKLMGVQDENEKNENGIKSEGGIRESLRNDGERERWGGC